MAKVLTETWNPNNTEGCSYQCFHQYLRIKLAESAVGVNKNIAVCSPFLRENDRSISGKMNLPTYRKKAGNATANTYKNTYTHTYIFKNIVSFI